MARVIYTQPHSNFIVDFDAKSFVRVYKSDDWGSACIVLRGKTGRTYHRYAKESAAEIQRRVDKVTDILQTWEGYISGIHGDEIYVRLQDITNPENPEEEAIFDINKFKEMIPDGDEQYIEEGMLLLWNISKKESSIKFYKDVWTQEMIDKARKCGEELYRRICDTSQ